MTPDRSRGQVAVAPATVVIRNICSHGCKRRPDLDQSVSYAFALKPASGTGKPRIFFIPHELTEDGYTQAQLEEIEHTLASLGFDLLPIDYNIH